jgi:hypothetical protein
MAYCTDKDIERLLAQPKHYLRPGEVDFSAQISDAEDDVNADLKALGFDVPYTSSVPQLVRQMTVFRTIQFLALRNSQYELAEKFERLADKKLKRIELGRSEAIEDDANVRGNEESSKGIVASASDGTRRFTKERMDLW